MGVVARRNAGEERGYDAAHLDGFRHEVRQVHEQYVRAHFHHLTHTKGEDACNKFVWRGYAAGSKERAATFGDGIERGYKQLKTQANQQQQ